MLFLLELVLGSYTFVSVSVSISTSIAIKLFVLFAWHFTSHISSYSLSALGRCSAVCCHSC